MATKDADPTPGISVTAVHIGGDSITDRLMPHVKKIAAGAGALVVVIVVYYSYRWYKHTQEEKATTVLVRGLELGDRAVKPEDASSAAPADGEPSWKTYGERAEATAAAIAKAGRARGAAAVYEANLLLTAGKLDAALAAFRKVGNGTSDDAVLAREGVGITLETQAAAATDPAMRQRLLEEALAAFRAVQPDDKGARRDYALFHEARVLEALGKPSEAVAPLTRALSVAPDSMLKQDIENRLAVLGAPVPEAPTPELVTP
ncbi:MAG: hypothetical protein IPL61_10725 [Myxococcales bacterium]|nr:hypothetical protein [Myxococcales bacterium]